MNISNVHDMYYMALYNGSRTLDSLENRFGLQLNRKYYRPKDLNKIVKKS